MTDLNAHCETRTREARNDPRATHEFVTMALTEPEEDAAWETVTMLHFRGTREVFDAARQLCASECPQERMLGANILGQLGVPERTFPKEAVAVLLEVLETETDQDVLDAACIALGHTPDSSSVPSLARLKTHSNARVRFGVVSALAGYEDDLAIKTKIEMSSDQDELVRDWATCGLGKIDVDSPEIRAALIARVSDEDEITRGEALVGLARRKDARAIEPLVKELERYYEAEHVDYSIEAAEEFAHPRLLPVLKALKELADADDTRLDEAIRRCSQVDVAYAKGSEVS
jgi:HEAT repeat protein